MQKTYDFCDRFRLREARSIRETGLPWRHGLALLGGGAEHPNVSTRAEFQSGGI
jgi:hypothetical protein